MALFDIHTSEINDSRSFHEIFKRVLGFPDFYGANMDAWIDCMSDLYGPKAMTSHCLSMGEAVEIRLIDSEEFGRRCPVLMKNLIECTRAVNCHYKEQGLSAYVSLVFC